MEKEIMDFLKIVSDKMDRFQSDVNDKIDRLQFDVSGKIDRLQSDVSDKMDRLQSDVSNKMDRFQSDVSDKIDRLQFDVSEIKVDLKHLQAQTNTLEKRVMDLDAIIRYVNTEVSDVKLDVNLLKQKVQ